MRFTIERVGAWIGIEDEGQPSKETHSQALLATLLGRRPLLGQLGFALLTFLLFAFVLFGLGLATLFGFFTALLGGLLVAMAILVPRLGGAEKLIISINSLLVVPLFAPTLWGLFGRKIGIRDMIIVALTSFGTGLALRFGVATNPRPK